MSFPFVNLKRKYTNELCCTSFTAANVGHIGEIIIGNIEDFSWTTK